MQKTPEIGTLRKNSLIIPYSDEWWAARKLLPTASRFADMCGTPYALNKYVCEKIAESAGVELEQYTSTDMERGTMLEGEAAEAYERATFRKTKEAHLFISEVDGLCFGATPDRLVGEDGILEIKCPRTTTHIGYIRAGRLPSDYALQVQGELMATGRAWCDFVSYNPRYTPQPLFIVRVFPDEETRAKIIKGLAKFWNEMNK